MISADEITLDAFQAALERYEGLVKSLEKKTRAGKTLTEMDEFRYVAAPAKYSTPAEGGDVTPLTHADLTRLVEWKLTHGKFRPKLLDLAASNPPETVAKTTKAAFQTYRANASDVPRAIKQLSELKGVGPATASLLLSVHDADRVVFFGDEVFLWLCRGAKTVPIKYNAKEYQELLAKAAKLIERLAVRAVDVEKVGYVLMKGGDHPAPKTANLVSTTAKVEPSATEKRKKDTKDAGDVRRLKRNKA